VFTTASAVNSPRDVPSTTHRKIARQVNESARDVARRRATMPGYAQSRRHRKTVGMLFAHLKRILRLDRLRLRGLTGARDEFLLAGHRAKPSKNGSVVDAEGPMTADAAPV